MCNSVTNNVVFFQLQKKIKFLLINHLNAILSIAFALIYIYIFI